MTLRGVLLRVALLVVAALLPASLLTSPAVSASTPETTYANQAFSATNSERTSRGMSALRKSTCLKRFAAKQAQRMADRGQLLHQPLEPIQRACGVGYVAENIATGYPNGRAAVAGWMASTQGHREAILSRNYTQMGIAARKAGRTWYVSQVFGRPM
jgi:uncharacterized protein YkwD